jgi:negative regulator of flagellin synthesis FlgM
MNIDKVNGSSFIQSYQKQMQVSKTEKTRPIQKEDELQISNEAKEMYGKNVKEVERQEKINALKAQVQSGEYQVNNQKVAEKIVGYWFK